MPRILLNAGHAPWMSKDGRYYPPGGGAPGEAAWAWRLAGLLATRLQAAGVACTVIGNVFNEPPPPEVAEDYALALSIHYDSAIYGAGNNTGCLIGRAVRDPMAAEADRFIALWQEIYPDATGIPLRQGRLNPNVTDYHLWRMTTPRTPGVLLEHGCGAPVGTGGYPPGDDAPFLHEQLETVAELDAQAILAFLGLPGVADPTPEPDQVAVLEAALAEANAIKSEFEVMLRDLESRRRLKRGTVDRLIAEARGY